MSAVSSIEWTDRTWNPVRGCSIVSAGCHNCYAMKFAHRFSGAGKPYEGLTKQTKAGPQWTGKITLVPESLNDPMTRRKPQRIFVNSMSDLFHESIPDEFIGQVLNAILFAGKAHGHTFQVLTKRPARMLDCMRRYYAPGGLDGTGNPSLRTAGLGDVIPWLHLGVSVEDQSTANERVPLLLQTPAAVRFVSAEPLIGPIDFTCIDWTSTLRARAAASAARQPNDSLKQEMLEIATEIAGATWNALSGYRTDGEDVIDAGAQLDWVIVGGESGPGARPCDLAWIRTIVQRCAVAMVPAFVKQAGSHIIDSATAFCEFSSFEQWVNKAQSWLGGISGGGVKYKARERCVCIDRVGRVCSRGADFARARDERTFPVTAHTPFTFNDRKGGDPTEWRADLRVRQFPATEARR